MAAMTCRRVGRVSITLGKSGAGATSAKNHGETLSLNIWKCGARIDSRIRLQGCGKRAEAGLLQLKILEYSHGSDIHMLCEKHFFPFLSCVRSEALLVTRPLLAALSQLLMCCISSPCL